MNLHVLAIGKKKSDYDPFVAEYAKRVTSPYSVTIEILAPSGLEAAETARTRESAQLAAKLQPGDVVIALDERGKDFTTVAFSQLLDKHLQRGAKRVVFLIGGAYGLDDEIKARAHVTMRLGALTLPHELARLVLAEQLYRATNLLAGGKYHHA